MNQRTVSANEYNNVINVATKYVEALRIGSVDMLAEIFHKDCVTYGTVNGELMGGASNPTADFIKDYGKSPEIVYHIDVLDITPTTAVVLSGLIAMTIYHLLNLIKVGLLLLRSFISLISDFSNINCININD